MSPGGVAVMLKIIAVCAAVSCVATSTFAATYTRTWVSGKGVDSTECGPIASPCRTLQRAYFNTNAGGEVNILDGAGYGSLDITKAISIVNDGAGVAGVLASAGSPGINISTGLDDSVVLRGLTIEGAGVGSNGIRFTNGGSLTISNVNIQGFTPTNSDGSSGNGIYLRPGSGEPRISISNVNISDNGHAAIRFRPAVGGKIAIDRLVASNNKYGVLSDTTAATVYTYATITNSVASNNIESGFAFYAADAGFSTRESHALLSASQAGGNNTGVYISGTGVYLTMANCAMAANKTDITGPSGIIFSAGQNTVRDTIGSSFTKSNLPPF